MNLDPWPKRSQLRLEHVGEAIIGNSSLGNLFSNVMGPTEVNLLEDILGVLKTMKYTSAVAAAVVGYGELHCGIPSCPTSSQFGRTIVDVSQGHEND